jgi:hypothetical protein
MKILPEYAGHECEYWTLAAVVMGTTLSLGIPFLETASQHQLATKAAELVKQEAKPIEQPAPRRPIPQGSTIYQATSGPVVIPKGLKIG